MMVSAAVLARVYRAHIYKILICVVCILIAIQYLCGAFDRRSLETIFTINTSRPPHQRTFMVYESATAAATAAEEEAAAAAAVVAANSSTGNASLPLLGTTTSTPRPVNDSRSNGSAPALSVLPLNSTARPRSLIQLGSTSSSTTTISSSTAIATSSTTAAPKNSSALCPAVPPNLVGPIAVSKTAPDLPAIEAMFTKVKPGGRGSPESCRARHRVAIVVPFRDRIEHLHTLLYNLHPLLQRQQLDYQIFVIEQKDNWQFNRAMLLNVGYKEALKERPFDCFIFHDVDLLPEDDRNLYNCPTQPRHMSVAIDKFLYRLPYADLFGGVSAMTTKQFELVNGFSNSYWGWGGEDDDMSSRIRSKGLHISRYPANIARYKMLVHKQEKTNPKRYDLLKTSSKRFANDGLNNLKYDVEDKKHHKLYTLLSVRLTPPSQPS